MSECTTCRVWIPQAGECIKCAASRQSRSKALLAASCSIMRRLVDKVNEDNEYESHECPNGSPCGVCQTVAEAEAFIAANNSITGG